MTATTAASTTNTGIGGDTELDEVSNSADDETPSWVYAFVAAVAVLGCCCAALAMLWGARANDDDEAASKAHPGEGLGSLENAHYYPPNGNASDEPGVFAGMAKEQQGWGFVGQGLESRVSQMTVADAGGADVDVTDTDRAVELWQEKKREAQENNDDYLALGDVQDGPQ